MGSLAKLSRGRTTHKMMLTAIALLLVSSVAFADNDCSDCDNMQFSASGGLESEYSRYMGEWFKVGEYDGRPMYMCPGIDCQGLDNVMAWINNQWRIVDCLPEDVGCGGSHNLIESTGAEDGNSCPYDDIAPWRYCTGSLTPGGCDAYESDATAMFTCL